MRRKKVFTEFKESLEESFDYIKRVKEINGSQVQIEMYETTLGFGCHGWFIEVWQVR